MIASAVTLRAADLLAVAGARAGGGAAPAVELAGGWAVGAGAAGLVLVARRWHGVAARCARPGPWCAFPACRALAAAGVAWALESAVVWEIARAAGFPLTRGEAVAVTAVTIAAQTSRVTPGGFGSLRGGGHRRAGGARRSGRAGVRDRVDDARREDRVLARRRRRSRWSGPAPTYWGRFRLPRVLPARPLRWPVAAEAPVVAFIPVYNEEATVGGVVRRLPATVGGRPLVTIVVDDGSTDDSARSRRAAGAVVVTQPGNLGLGAAVRRGLAEAVALGRPRSSTWTPTASTSRRTSSCSPRRCWPVPPTTWSGPGSPARSTGCCRTGGSATACSPGGCGGSPAADLTDGQSGYRAFSPEAAARAEVIHDYNYAQVLTLDLLAKGFAYAEVPIRYSFRERHVVREAGPLPAEGRAGGAPGAERGAQSSTTWGRSARGPRSRLGSNGRRAQGVDRVVGHRQRVVGVVVHEQSGRPNVVTRRASGPSRPRRAGRPGSRARTPDTRG